MTYLKSQIVCRFSLSHFSRAHFSLFTPSLFTFYLSLFTFLGPLSMSAQGYGTAAGLRIGSGIGITLQQQIALNTTIEGILQREFSNSDATLSLLYERHQNVLTKGLNIYAGGGVYYTWIANDANAIVQPKNAFGLSPIAGAELTIGSFNVAFDFKPNIKLTGSGTGFQMQSALSVRYVLAGRYFKDESWKFWKKWGKKS
jgi:hypothetical protein